MNWSTDILALGSVAVDDMIYAPYAPPNVKTRVNRRERNFGGQAATALFAAARLGVACAYAGVLGTDEWSLPAIENMRRAGIDLTYLRQDSQAQAIYSLVIVDEQRHTRNIYYQSSPRSGAATDWPPESVLRACRVLLVDQHGIDGMTRAARIAHAAGIPIVGDLEAAPPGSEDLFALVNHMIVPDAFAEDLTHTRTPAEAALGLWNEHRAAVVVTCGGNGGWYLERGMDQPGHYPAFPVQVVDTTGCGDVFHGAYAFGLLRGMPLNERIRLASAAAAIKATRRGGQQGCPTLEQLESFLESSGVE